MKIDINIKASRKKKKQPAQDQDIVWPTMLPDDDPLFFKTQLVYLDAGTKLIDINFLDLVDDNTVRVTGNYMDLLFIGEMVSVEYTEDQDGTPVTKRVFWNITSLAISGEAAAPIMTVGLQLGEKALPETITKILAWGCCPDWSGPLSCVFTDTQDLTAPREIWYGPWYATRPTHFEMKCYANADSRLPASTILAQFDPNTNPDWKLRKPLGKVDLVERDEWKRSELGGNQFNIYARLKNPGTPAPEDDHRFICNLDYLRDESNWKQPGSAEGLVYKSGKFRNGRFDLEVKEIGTASICNYLYKYATEPDGSPPIDQEVPDIEIKTKFLADVIQRPTLDDNGNVVQEPAGIFFSPFDTSDRVNFKVTTSPVYTAEEYTGPVIRAGKKNLIQMFSRRWAYNNRARELSVPGETIAFFSTSATPADMWLMPKIAPGFLGVDEELNLVSGPYSIVYEQDQYGQTATSTVKVWYQKYRVGLWWDRFPLNMKPFLTDDQKGVSERSCHYSLLSNNHPTTEQSAQQAVYVVPDMIKEFVQRTFPTFPFTVNALQLISFSADPDLISNDPESPQYLFLKNRNPWGFGGGGIPHYFEGQPSPVTGKWELDFERIDSLGEKPALWDAIWQKIAGIPNINHQEGYTGFLWVPNIRSSAFWTDYNLPSFSQENIYSKWDNIPYGVGLSPDKAGALVGIVSNESGSRMYYVWRKTDEDMALADLTMPDNSDIPAATLPWDEYDTYEGHTLSFESLSSDGCTTPFKHNYLMRPGTTPFANETPTFWDLDERAEFVDQFSGPGKRELRKLGRGLVITEVGQEWNDEPSHGFNVLYVGGSMVYWKPGGEPFVQLHPATPVNGVYEYTISVDPPSNLYICDENWNVIGMADNVYVVGYIYSPPGPGTEPWTALIQIEGTPEASVNLHAPVFVMFSREMDQFYPAIPGGRVTNRWCVPSWRCGRVSRYPQLTELANNKAMPTSFKFNTPY